MSKNCSYCESQFTTLSHGRFDVYKFKITSFCSRKCYFLGRKIWNKGLKMSPDFCKQISLRMRGKPANPKAIEKMAQKNKGNKYALGNKHSEEAKNKIRIAVLKRETSISDWIRAHPNELHPQWRGGISPKNHLIRKSKRMKLWRISVFERDDYTCIWCKRKGVNLQADHIKPFAYFPELRFEITNGRTLCRECHMKTDTYMGRARKNYAPKT